MDLGPPLDIDKRRAVLGVLLRARGPVTVGEVIEAVRVEHIGLTPKAAANLLAYQCKVGHACRTERGTYAARTNGISRSMQWRCLNWQLVRQQERARSFELFGHHDEPPRSTTEHAPAPANETSLGGGQLLERLGQQTVGMDSFSLLGMPKHEGGLHDS
jgi:hypothetical protein